MTLFFSPSTQQNNRHSFILNHIFYSQQLSHIFSTKNILTLCLFCLSPFNNYCCIYTCILYNYVYYIYIYNVIYILYIYIYNVYIYYYCTFEFESPKFILYHTESKCVFKYICLQQFLYHHIYIVLYIHKYSYVCLDVYIYIYI